MKKKLLAMLTEIFTLHGQSIAVLVFAIFLLSFIWIGLNHMIENEQRVEIDDAIRDTARYARAFEEHTRRIILSSDEAVLFLKYEYEREGKDTNIHKYISEGRFDNQPFVLMSIADENGDLVASSQVPFVPSNIKDREHFQVHTKQDTGKLFISKPVLGRSSGKWSIQFTRRINKPDGAFGGVAVVSVDPFYFSEFYRQIDLGKNSSVALVGNDGIIRARQSEQNHDIGQDIKNSIVINKLLDDPASYYIQKSMVDGIERIYSYRALGDYPLAVVVGVDKNEVFKELDDRVKDYRLHAAMATIIIIGFTVMLMRSFSSQKKVERQLVQRNDELLTLINTLPGYAFCFDKSGKYIMVNQSYAGRLGLPLGEVLGKTVFDLFPADIAQKYWEENQSILATGSPVGIEEELLNNGDKVYVYTRKVPVKGQNGTITGIIGLTFDITELKCMEEELLAAKEKAEASNQAKTKFIRNMSHELRTPLNAVIGFSEVLGDQYFGSLNAKQMEYVSDITDSAKHLLFLINDVLDLAKIETGRVELDCKEVAVYEMLCHSLVMAKERAKRNQISLSVDCSPEIRELKIKIDERKINQVLFNLLSNASKFTPAGGKISLSASVAGDELLISVSDTGIGVAQDYLNVIFESFYQVKNEFTSKTPGTGLGLSIAQSLVALHGGRIWASSGGVGKGTTVTFTLPLSKRPLGETA